MRVSVWGQKIYSILFMMIAMRWLVSCLSFLALIHANGSRSNSAFFHSSILSFSLRCAFVKLIETKKELKRRRCKKSEQRKVRNGLFETWCSDSEHILHSRTHQIEKKSGNRTKTMMTMMKEEEIKIINAD